MPQPTVIIGAGLTGLSCALHLRDAAVVLEASDAPGGAARTFHRQGFAFDCTGHWLHFKDADMRALVERLLPGELLHVARRAAVFSHGVLTPYPFQAHTFGLPPAVVADCLLGFFAARERAAAGNVAAPESFADYIEARMGAGIAQHFMFPYNTKLWTVHPREMAHAWCGRFVPLPTPEEVVYGALQPGGQGTALGYNAAFYYPRQGGIGRLGQALTAALRSPPRCHTAVTAIALGARRLTLQNGETLGFDRLVATLPLPQLVRLIDAVPEAVQAAAATLRATAVTYWDVGVARPNRPDDPHWIYYPEADVPFYRAGSASAAVPGMAPAGHASFYVETAHPQGTSCPVSDAAVLRGMRRVGLLGPREEPILWHRTTIGCAYVIMDHAYGEARALILAWLGSHGIIPAGRYGAWMYDSMEGALLQGRAAAQACTP